jgi:hypothetical protein
MKTFRAVLAFIAKAILAIAWLFVILVILAMATGRLG